jgi:hypothetical protein
MGAVATRLLSVSWVCVGLKAIFLVVMQLYTVLRPGANGK